MDLLKRTRKPSVTPAINLLEADSTALQESQRMMVNYPTYSTWEGLADSSGANAISNSVYGAGAAYIAVSAVRACLDTYAWAVGQIPTKIIENTTPLRENDVIVAQSDDVRPRHIWYEAEKWHRRKFNIGLLPAMIYNQMLYDTVFVYKHLSQFDTNPRLQVLASEAVTVYDPLGDIEYYNYDYPGGMQQIKPDRMAYNHGYNPQDANRGSSIVSSIILELNIDHNLKRFLQAFFANDAMPGMVGSPEGGLSEKEWKELKELLKQHYKGVGNRRRSLILPFDFNFEVMDEPDIQKHYSLHDPMRQEIFAAFGVPLVLVGDNSSTPYKDADNVLANFINLRVKPIAQDIQTFNNDSCLPWLDHSGTTRFEFDFSQYVLPSEADTTRISMAVSAYQGEIATLNQAREKAGWETIEGGDVFKNGKSIDDLKAQSAPIITVTKPAPALLSAVTPRSLSTDGHTVPIRTWVLDNPDSLQTAQMAELEAWERFLKARQGKASVRAFNVDYLRGMVGDTLQVALIAGDYKAAFKAAREKLALRDIQATRLQFEDAFDTAIRSALSGDMNRLTWGNEMRRIVRRGINAAYRDGLKAGGVEDEPDEIEQDEIATLFEDQREYINSLAVALFKDETVSQSMADQKPAMWWGKSIQPAYYAGFNSAAGNQMVEFVGDDGEVEPCRECQLLKGQVHRLKDWIRKMLVPVTNGDSFTCGGFVCKHQLIPTTGKARGNWL